MSVGAQAEYLNSEVLTAPPQRLQLMLIEGAIRFVVRARNHWAADEVGAASELLIRAQEIVGQLIAGAASDPTSQLGKKVAANYIFIFRSLSEAGLRHSETQLADALRILEIERETWREVCNKLGSDPTSSAPQKPAAKSSVPAPLAMNDTPSSSFSFQA